MYYCIRDNKIIETNRKNWEENSGGIGVFDAEDWSNELNLREEFSLKQEDDQIFFCKMERYPSYLLGTFHIPVKKKERRSFKFVVYVLKERLIFVEEGGFIGNLICKMQERIGEADYTLEQFLGDFFMTLIEEDILYLAALEREIAEMEEGVLQGDTEHFNYRMLGIKKEISRLYCYYSQMTDIGESFCEQQNSCRIFTERVNRLQQEAQSLREYAMQVQDVYQAEIAIHQNDIMKVLTVVTTIFLPLTLIAGWYGMNFYNMPELRWEYGYGVITGISLLIVIVSLWIFKKKKFF